MMKMREGEDCLYSNKIRNRVLYLAVPSQIYNDFFHLRFIEEGVKEYQLFLAIYDIEKKSILQWIK
ncbi:element excision factor XisH family protein [Geminocystis sp. CENA526]|uniref:element excision factor XisH family protein n=1 Tax=Geminocystis sp. CENA526 TaxID=1355871 RepID=UPI003D6EBD46